MMFNLQRTMKLLLVFPLIWFEATFGVRSEPNVITVEEGSDVILPCSLSSKEDIVFKIFNWKRDDQKQVFRYDGGIHSNNGIRGQDEQFKGRVSHFEDGLKSGNASIIIRNTTVADSGVYTCEFPQLQPRQTFHIKLLVYEPDVITVEEGSDVILPCSLSSKESIVFKLFDWKKDGQKKVFGYDSGILTNDGREGQDEQFKGRVSHFEDGLKSGNAAITIRNTKGADSGDYTCEFLKLQPRQIFHIKLHVVGVIIVEEGRNVILPCSPSSKESIEFKRFDWKKDDQEVFVYDSGITTPSDQFKGRVSHFEDELKSGNASIIIRNTTVADSGNYTCELPQLQPRQIFHIKLFVIDGILKDRTDENIPGAAPKPYVTILDQTKNQALLQCEVRGAFPKPKLHWQDSDGNILQAEEPKVTERGGRYDVILQITVTKTDYYRCVATQEEISHQIYSETYVYISVGWIITIVVLCLLGLIGGVALAVLIWKGYITINGKKGPCSRWTVAAICIGLLVPVVGVVALAVLIWKGYITIKRKKGELKDRTDENIPGAAPKPDISILNQTKNWAVLQCEVRGASPKPKLHWQDSDGNILPAEEPKVTVRGGNYDVILQTNVTKTDYYRCVATQEKICHQIEAETHVHISEPNVITVEGSDVILPCSLSSKENIVFKKFEWKKDGQKKVFVYDSGIHTKDGDVGQDEQFKGRVSYFEDKLKSGNASIIIRNTKLADSGNYTCEFLQPRQIFHIKLVVVDDILKDRRAENIPGAAPEPNVKILSQTKNWAVLQCEVRGAFPKPKLHWQDSDGNILPAEEPKVTERGGSYDVILKTTVTKTDYYRCVATQEEINHQIYAEIHVNISRILDGKPENNSGDLKDRTDENIPGAAPEPNVKILSQTKNWAVLQCEVRGAFPKPKLHWQDSDGNILPAEEPKVTERGGRYDVILQTIVRKSDKYRCVATQEKINHRIYAEKHVVFFDGEPENNSDRISKDRRAENIPAPKPNVKIFNHTKNWALLEGEVRGAFPKPKLHWEDSDGNKLRAEKPKVTERGGRCDVILQIAVKKTDDYRCVATQEEINHQTDAKIHVFISDPLPQTGGIPLNDFNRAEKERLLVDEHRV